MEKIFKEDELRDDELSFGNKYTTLVYNSGKVDAICSIICFVAKENPSNKELIEALVEARDSLNIQITNFMHEEED